jgi:dCMP deaminase
MNRLNWDRYAIGLAHAAAQRSEDPNTKVGAVILRHDKTVGATGYNGPPPGIDWRPEWTASRSEKYRFVVHAELNVLFGIRRGEGWLLGCTHGPCEACLLHIRAHGITRVVFEIRHEKTASDEYARSLGVELVQI